MIQSIQHWDKEIFLAYVLIHAANANFEITPEEKKMILSLVSQSAYSKTLIEYKKDNDYQGINKILSAKKHLNFCKEDCELMIYEIEQVFIADGKYDDQEHSLFYGIKKLLLN